MPLHNATLLRIEEVPEGSDLLADEDAVVWGLVYVAEVKDEYVHYKKSVGKVTSTKQLFDIHS